MIQKIIFSNSSILFYGLNATFITMDKISLSDSKTLFQSINTTVLNSETQIISSAPDFSVIVSTSDIKPISVVNSSEDF